MSHLRVNRISPRTGTSIQIDGTLGFEDLTMAGPTLHVLHPTFGGVGDGVEDDIGPIHAALAAADARTNGSEATKAEVYLGPGTYAHSEPIRIDASNLRLKGAGRTYTMLHPTFYGPAIVVAPPTDVYGTMPTGAALIGSGQSFSIGGTGTPYFNLSDDIRLTLNGLSAFTIEFWFRSSSLSAGAFNMIMGANGTRVQGESGDTESFSVYVDPSTSPDLLIATVNIGGTLESVAYDFTNDATTAIAITYDGSNLRLYTDGVLRDTEAATGDVVQAAHHCLMVGYYASKGFPDGENLQHTAIGRIDSLRISTVARYTGASYTVATDKLTSDANTLFLSNWSTSELEDIFLRPTVEGSQNSWLPMRRRDFPGLLSGVAIEDLEIRCSGHATGIFSSMTVRSHLRRVTVAFLGAYGILRHNNAFLWTYEDVACEPAMDGSRFCHGQALICGAGAQYNTVLTGGVYPMASNGGDDVWHSPFITPDQNTRICAVIQGSGDSTFSMFGRGVDNEGSDDAVFEGAFALSQVMSFEFVDVHLEGGVSPALTIGSSVLSGSVQGGRVVCASADHVVRFAAAPTNPIVFRNCPQLGGPAPWAESGMEQWVRVEEYGHVSTGPATLADADTTPSIRGSRWWLASNSGATSITDFDDASDGWVIEVEFTNGNTTIVDGASIQLAGGANFVGSADDILTLRYRNGVWREVGRSVN